MFSDYFIKLEKNLLKKSKTTTKGKSKTGKTAASKKDSAFDRKEVMEKLRKIIPAHLEMDSVRMIDPSGYSPEGADFIVFKEYFKDIVTMMNGFVPAELVHATYHISPNLNQKGLVNILNKVVQTKKTNRYIERDMDMPLIPAFIIAQKTEYDLPELKNSILNYYTSKGIGNEYEVDIIVILKTGVIIKNWREKRSYIALETKEDSLMWFFILMNEYLEVDRKSDFDLRDYVKQSEKYEEY